VPVSGRAERLRTRDLLPLLAEGECCAPLVREPISAEQAPRLAALFKALADPVRLRLLSMIASHEGGEICVCDLTDEFEVSQPTVSHHLRVLREAGLVQADRRGVWAYYRLVPETVQALAGIFDTAPAAAAR